jgi:hypothetical protein
MGQLAGVLGIPTLGLSAPVEQGNDDAELSVAAGHAPASVWPGEHGTAVVLAHDGLTLTQNETPMGSMSLTGETSLAFQQSPEPLGLVAAGLQEHFGGIHATEQNRADWWSAIAPGVVMPKPLEGASITGHDSPLNVAIDSKGGTAATVTLTTRITVSGGYDPGVYDQTVTLGVTGSVVTIRTWGMTHG